MGEKIYISSLKRVIMKYDKILILFLLVVLLGVHYCTNREDMTYSVTIESYKDNKSYVEYPQISGSKDKRKEKDINQLLKNQIFDGAKNYLNEPIVNFSETNTIYKFKCGVGLKNKYISSFWYQITCLDVGASGEVSSGDDRLFFITVDMMTGEKIDLTDLMIVDERLINSTDGTGKKTDYDTATTPTYHTFKDAYMVYSSEEEEDSYHIFTVTQVIDDFLTDTNSETTWYIDKQKNIVFHFLDNSIVIPYMEISELIYPKYHKVFE